MLHIDENHTIYITNEVIKFNTCPCVHRNQSHNINNKEEG